MRKSDFPYKRINEFLDDSAAKLNMIAIGYSNEANIATSLLFHYENAP